MKRALYLPHSSSSPHKTLVHCHRRPSPFTIVQSFTTSSRAFRQAHSWTQVFFLCHAYRVELNRDESSIMTYLLWCTFPAMSLFVCRWWCLKLPSQADLLKLRSTWLCLPSFESCALLQDLFPIPSCPSLSLSCASWLG